MSLDSKDLASEHQNSSFHAAAARTVTRGLALYFSRPVRLFRPSKVSGWHSLRSHAMQHGVSLTPQYISSLVKNQGLQVILRHFIPPMIMNTALGTILWTTYSGTSYFLESHISGRHSLLVSTLSGSIAGGVQALAAAPAENVRLLLEGGSGKGWSHAWKEVFHGTTPSLPTKSKRRLREARQVRKWMREVRDMAGRGWDGWAWGCAKDVCGFAAFFAVFEATRKVSVAAKTASQHAVEKLSPMQDTDQKYHHLPRIVHALTLVCGGVLAGITYEALCRPWDVARRIVYLDRVKRLSPDYSASRSVTQFLCEHGALALFKNPGADLTDKTSSVKGRSRVYTVLRTLARVGPWGVGFLVWEAFGPGLG